MSIKGIIYSNQTVSAAEHAMLFRRFIGDGILTGCGISYRFNVCTISEGAFVVAGRLTRILGEESITCTNTSGYARIKGVIDLNQAATINEFGQFKFEVDYANTSTGFPALVQEDVNSNGTKYEVEWAVLSLGSSGITGIVRSISTSSGGEGGGDSGGSDSGVTENGYSFTGISRYFSDSTHYEIVLLSNGDLTFVDNPGQVDVFAVGPGGDGDPASYTSTHGYAGKGGNGGEVVTVTGVALAKNTKYSIKIGTTGTGVTSGLPGITAYGGNHSSWSSSKGKTGGQRSITHKDGGSQAPGDGVAGVLAFGKSDTLYQPRRLYGASAGGGATSHDTANNGGWTSQDGGAGKNTGSGYGGSASSDPGAAGDASVQNTGAAGGGASFCFGGYGGARKAGLAGKGASGIMIISGKISA